MAQYQLGTANFATTPERDRLIALRSRYLELGHEHRDDFLSDYSDYKNADELFEDLPDVLEAALSETVSMVADDIAANRVYDMDTQTIQAELTSRIASIREDFDRVQHQYFEILGKAEELDAQRREARENRGGVIGGGFGVEGAAQGIAIATLANAAIGLTHGLVNLTAKAASALGDSRKKRELLEDPETKRVMADFLCSAVLQGHELVAETINKASGATVFEAVSPEAAGKSAAIAKNISAGRVPEADIQTVLLQALELDPFNEAAWTTWIDRLGDEDGSVEACATALGILAVERHKAKLIAARKSELPWSTPEECRESGLALEPLTSRLGVPFEEERARISKLADALDQARRTYDGVVYSSVAEANAARQTFESEQARIAAEADDLRQRTFKGVTYETREEAREALVRSNKLEKRVIFGALGSLLAITFLVSVFFNPPEAPNMSDFDDDAKESPITNPSVEADSRGGFVANDRSPPEGMPSAASVTDFGCPGHYSDVTFSQESGDGSGLYITVSSNGLTRFESWEGGLFQAEIEMIDVEHNAIEAEIRFPQFEDDTYHISLSCSSKGLRIDGNGVFDRTLKKLTDEDIETINR